MSKSLMKGCEYLLNNTAPVELFTPEDFSDEQRQIADTTEQFVKNDVLPHVEEIDQQNFSLAVDLMHKSAELGLLMAEIPEEYGGLELDKASGMLVAEKMGATGAFGTTFMAHTGIGTLPLVYYGTAEQKGRYLDKLGSGEWLAAYCLTEPDSGSDALGAKATATLSEDGSCYILNGTKQFITNAAFADLFTVFAKIDKEHFTGFLVERTLPGVSLGNEEKKLGIKGSSTRQLILDNVRVPRENLLGEIGKGHKIAFNVLNVGRIKLGAGAVGGSKIAFAAGAAYANERKQFGRSIASFGAIREKLADMTAGIFASEAIVYRLAGLIDSRIALIDRDTPNYYEQYQQAIEEYAAECAISKVYCSEVAAICKLLLVVLKFFHTWTGNWGFSIILLTVSAKLLLLPLTHKAMVSAESMKKLQPKMEEIRKKYADDKEKQNLETMKLYQTEKVNPLGGCLPLLVQLPIWAALFTTLRTSYDLYGMPFIGPVWTDLTLKDPTFILPLALGVTMFITQKLQPQMMDPAQAKMFLYFMPVFFTVIMLSYPAGLSLYIFTNNLLSIAQQFALRRYLKATGQSAPDVPKKPSDQKK